MLSQVPRKRAVKTNGFSLRYSSDPEYNPDFHSSVKQRMSSGSPRAMPELVTDTTNIPMVTMPKTNELRPYVKLPESNLQKLEKPPGINYNDGFQWDLAQLIEGKAVCLEPLPSWEIDGIHFRISELLG